MACYHIHFGAGKLGLGFVLPILSNLNVPIALFQRPQSQEWKQLTREKDVIVSVNSQALLQCKFINDECKLEDLDKYIQHKEHLFVSTSNVDLLRAVLEQTSSFSTAVGTQGLADVVAGIDLLDPYPPDVRVYAFENDFKAVDEFRHRITETHPELTVVSVMCDRICTSREIESSSNSVNIVTEEFPGNAVIFCSQHPSCYPFTTPGATRRMCTPKTVVLAHTKEEEDFYYNRKYSLLNGVHYTMAVFVYAQLLDDGVPPDEWANAPLALWKKNPKNEEELNTLVTARIIHLMHRTDKKTLHDIYESEDKAEIYQELKNYSTVVLERIASTNDTAGRILNLKNATAVRSKYSQHFMPLSKFLCNGDDISLADLDGLPTHYRLVSALKTWEARVKQAALAHNIDLDQHEDTPQDNNKRINKLPFIYKNGSGTPRRMSAVELMETQQKAMSNRRASVVAAVGTLISALPSMRRAQALPVPV